MAEQCYRITRLSAGGVAAAPVKLLARCMGECGQSVGRLIRAVQQGMRCNAIALASTAKRLTHTCAKEGGPPKFWALWFKIS